MRLPQSWDQSKIFPRLLRVVSPFTTSLTCCGIFHEYFMSLRLLGKLFIIPNGSLFEFDIVCLHVIKRWEGQAVGSDLHKTLISINSSDPSS